MSKAIAILRKSNPTQELGVAMARLQQSVGPVDPALAASLGELQLPPSVAAAARTLSMSRVLNEAVRISGQAFHFWTRATPIQRERLRGISLPLLAATVSAASRLELRLGERVAVDDELAQAAAEALAVAHGLWEQCRILLVDLAGTEERRAEVREASGEGLDAVAVARGLDAQAALLRRWVSGREPPLVLRLRTARLDERFAFELAATAARLRQTEGRELHGESSVLDGEDMEAVARTLALIGLILRAFAVAHERDPSIPRLIPVATRRVWLGRTESEGSAPAVRAPSRRRS